MRKRLPAPLSLDLISLQNSCPSATPGPAQVLGTAPPFPGILCHPLELREGIQHPYGHIPGGIPIIPPGSFPKVSPSPSPFGIWENSKGGQGSGGIPSIKFFFSSFNGSLTFPEKLFGISGALNLLRTFVPAGSGCFHLNSSLFSSSKGIPSLHLTHEKNFLISITGSGNVGSDKFLWTERTLENGVGLGKSAFIQ